MIITKATFFGAVTGLGILLGAISGAIAADTTPHMSPPPSSQQFQPIDQPLGHKLAVTLGGLGLIGLELWWFRFSHPKSRQPVPPSPPGQLEARTIRSNP